MGSNSFFNKLVHYDPINAATGGKFLQYTDPAMNALAGKYNPNHSGPGTPGPYAGVAPTLAAAKAGYTGMPAGAAPGSQVAANQNAAFNPYVHASAAIAQQYGRPQVGLDKTGQPTSITAGGPYG